MSMNLAPDPVLLTIVLYIAFVFTSIYYVAIKFFLWKDTLLDMCAPVPLKLI